MSEQKPVARMSRFDIHVTDEGSEICESLNGYAEFIDLFTAEQLKAEREKAVRDVIKIFNKEATRCLHAAEEVNPLTILKLVGKLLSTDESKDEAK